MQSSYIQGYPNICINFHTATVGNYGQSAFLQYMAQALEGYIKKDGADVGIALAVEAIMLLTLINQTKLCFKHTEMQLFQMHQNMLV